jgi:hypothetical protein
MRPIRVTSKKIQFWGTGMLTVHHLGRSQSERIVWLCERRWHRKALGHRRAAPDH